MTRAQHLIVALLASCGCVGFAAAEIVSIEGNTALDLIETTGGTQTASTSTSSSYPSSNPSLPLQSTGLLVASTEDAAASAGAQFDEPNFPGLTFSDPNSIDPASPEDFAISMGLGSDSASVTYDGYASVTTRREIIFNEGELGDETDGELVDLIGSVYLEGALTILSEVSGQDLSSAFVTLDVVVTKLPLDESSRETVFSGTITVTGTSDGSITVTADGDIPLGSLSQNDLALLVPDFAVFDVLIIPGITVEYDYQAEVGTGFVLETEVTVEAFCPGGGTVVGAILGTPYPALVDVVTVIQNQQVAQDIQARVLAERAEPTGKPAFPSQSAQDLDNDGDEAIAFSFCGPMGFTALLGLMSLVGVSARRRR